MMDAGWVTLKDLLCSWPLNPVGVLNVAKCVSDFEYNLPPGFLLHNVYEVLLLYLY